MKMIWAIIRPEFTQRVIGALDHAGIGAMTHIPFRSPGGEMNGPPAPPGVHDTSSEILMIAVSDHEVAKAVKIIRAAARLEEPGRDGQETESGGKIFVTFIDEVFTIRTAGGMSRVS